MDTCGRLWPPLAAEPGENDSTFSVKKFLHHHDLVRQDIFVELACTGNNPSKNSSYAIAKDLCHVKNAAPDVKILFDIRSVKNKPKVSTGL